MPSVESADGLFGVSDTLPSMDRFARGITRGY